MEIGNLETTTLFVGKLTKQVRQIHLITLFSQYGTVLKARVIPRPTNPNFKMGFVEMSKADAEHVLQHKLKMDGVMLVIQVAVSQPSQHSVRIDEIRQKLNKVRTYEPDPTCLKAAESTYRIRKKRKK